MDILFNFAATEIHAQPEGLAALGLNLQSFLFQLITFVIVLVILKTFVYKKLVATLEGRRQAVEDSLKHAEETQKKLAKAEDKISDMLKEARAQSDEIVETGHKAAAGLIEAAQEKAVKRAEHIIAEAKTQMNQEVLKAREDLKKDTMHLVALATEKIIDEKLDAKKDEALIKSAISGAKK